MLFAAVNQKGNTWSLHVSCNTDLNWVNYVFSFLGGLSGERVEDVHYLGKGSTLKWQYNENHVFPILSHFET